MAERSDIRVSFSVDLKPYASGLKTMLVMTQSAGKQITPLLNMQVDAPDFSEVDRSIKQYEEELERLRKEAAETKAGQDQLGDSVDGVGKKSDDAGKKIDRKTTSMKGMKRQALETFGAVSFLTQNIVQMAASAGGGSEKLEKLSRGMSQGISAGFGLASTIKMIGFAAGPTAVTIGAVVAVGVSLINFFSNTEAKAKLATKAMDDFNLSLKGARISDLKVQANLITGEIAKIQEKIGLFEEDKKRAIEEADKWALAAAISGIKREEESLKKLKEQREATNKLIESMEKSHAEVVRETQQLIVSAIEDRFERERAGAKAEFEEKKRAGLDSRATEEERNRYITAARAELIRKLRDIDKQEADEKRRLQEEADRNSEERARKEQEHQKLIRSLQTQTAIALLDTEEQKELATEQGEIARLAIQERYALLRLDLQHNEAIAYAKSEEEKTALTAKHEAERQKIRAGTAGKVGGLEAEAAPAGSILAQQKRILDLRKEYERATEEVVRDRIRAELRMEQEKYDRLTMSQAELLDRERNTQAERRRQWGETHQVQMALIDGFTTGFVEMFGQMLIRQRQAKDEWDAVWLAARNTVLQTLAQILAEQIKNAIIGGATTAAATTATVASMGVIAAAAAPAAGLVSIATFGGAAAAGTAAVLSSLATIQIAARIPGFEFGGKTKRGEVGFIEGKHPEIIAPEKDFYHIARTEMIPRLMAITRQSETRPFSMPAGDNVLQRLEETLARLEERLSKLEITGRFNGREIELALDENRRSRKRAGQSD